MHFLWFTSITFKQTPSSENKLAIKVKKTKLMLTGSKTMLLLFDDIDLQMNGTQVECAIMQISRSNNGCKMELEATY